MQGGHVEGNHYWQNLHRRQAADLQLFDVERRFLASQGRTAINLRMDSIRKGVVRKLSDNNNRQVSIIGVVV